MSNEDETKTTREILAECLSQQLSEFELILSMYNEKDIIFSGKDIIHRIRLFVNGLTDSVPENLDFILKLSLENKKLELCINLPTLYPNEQPEMFVRCNHLSRQQETNLNIELVKYVKESHCGEVLIYNVVTWLQDNVHDLLEDKGIVEEKRTINTNEKFARYWIYSHHIYNKKKREEILSKAKEFCLTGFSLPGKPGVICIEGTNTNCDEWWRIIKGMTWKKITMKNMEVFDIVEQAEKQKFCKFEEISFPNVSSRHSKHADMSGFSKYMEEHGLSETFNDFFGISKDR